MRSMRTLTASLAILSGLCLGAPMAASAQDADAEEGDEVYRALLEGAVNEYNGGHYAEAGALFRQAHERAPNARTLRGMGMAAFEMREYVEALRALEGALAQTERPLTDPQRAHVQSLVQRANAFVGRYRVVLSPASAELLVDEAPARIAEDGTLLLNLGEHTVEARCPNCRSERRTVRVRGGETRELTFELAPLEDEAEPTPASPPSPAPVAPPRDSGTGSAAGVALLALGGAFALGAGGGIWWWLDRDDELDLCRGAGDACRNEDTLAAERDMAAGVTIALGVAAIGTAVTGAIVLGGDDDDDGAVSLSCVPMFGGVGCAGRF